VLCAVHAAGPKPEELQPLTTRDQQLATTDSIQVASNMTQRMMAYLLITLMKRFLMLAAGRAGSSSVAMQDVTMSKGVSAVVNLCSSQHNTCASFIACQRSREPVQQPAQHMRQLYSMSAQS
jgi:hypothetical protein